MHAGNQEQGQHAGDPQGQHAEGQGQQPQEASPGPHKKSAGEQSGGPGMKCKAAVLFGSKSGGPLPPPAGRAAPPPQLTPPPARRVATPPPSPPTPPPADAAQRTFLSGALWQPLQARSRQLEGKKRRLRARCVELEAGSKQQRPARNAGLGHGSAAAPSRAVWGWRRGLLVPMAAVMCVCPQACCITGSRTRGLEAGSGQQDRPRDAGLCVATCDHVQLQGRCEELLQRAAAGCSRAAAWSACAATARGAERSAAAAGRGLPVAGGVGAQPAQLAAPTPGGL